jgi:hypothetical protein
MEAPNKSQVFFIEVLPALFLVWMKNSGEFIFDAEMSTEMITENLTAVQSNPYTISFHVTFELAGNEFAIFSEWEFEETLKAKAYDYFFEIYSEIPEGARSFFDLEKFIREMKYANEEQHILGYENLDFFGYKRDNPRSLDRLVVLWREA